MAHTKCIIAIVFLACQVHTQASVEVQSGTSLLFTLDQNQPGHQTGVSPVNDGNGTCQLIEVAATSATCNVKITILNSTSSLSSHAGCPAPSCPTSPPPPPCPTLPPAPVLLSGYERVPNLGCYKYHTTLTTWTQAKQTCEEEGSHLTIINSEAESKAISNIMKRDKGKVTEYSDASWLGLVESNTTQNEYYTVLGDPLSATGFVRWRPGFPARTKSLGDNVYLYSRDGSFADYSSTYLLAFTCEQFTC